MTQELQLQNKVDSIMEYLTTSLDTPYHGSSSMTPCIYDTAWLALIIKPEGVFNDHRDAAQHLHSQWLFPECFQAVLDSQSTDGGFGSSRASRVDEVMNAMAAVLALSKHAHNPTVTPSSSCSPSDLQERIDRGIRYLHSALSTWDNEAVLATDHVGFEILIPCLLDLLKAEGGIDLRASFPGHAALMQLNARKMARFHPSMLYSTRKTTLLHSLEAFIGRIDFDAVAHHLTHGAMLNSPSSTAAYLMHATRWDARAEAYLRFVVEQGVGAMVPSAFPITMFEISWCLSTLLESGHSTQQLGEDAVHKLTTFVTRQLEESDGVCGFAPGVVPDADDTAKCIFFLNSTGRQTSCDRMVEVFEDEAHFKTYDLEVTDSFSANCNVLKALLTSSNPARHQPQISKVLRYLCQRWHRGGLTDKWNLRPQYSMMLLTEALVLALQRWDHGDLPEILPELMGHQGILRVLAEITVQLLQTPHAAEITGDAASAEVTGYTLLALKRIASLPWSLPLGERIDTAIVEATRHLQIHEGTWTLAQDHWIEKVSYGSRLLSLTYCVAALGAPQFHRWGPRVLRLCLLSVEEEEKKEKEETQYKALDVMLPSRLQVIA
ncbi:hypothetical protein ASPACDRAFT_1886662 [Aspergillus aculeatus ATCC 16872]|uniref:Uncharacterized protein n=1 Tax=Aspergillus aculeatus (strain ATCC 16872 / CBS 172.66 / WB 5094) TaxID=690307 RepID=A0A1L9X2D6_ASPA1|nr:uncharacterized protein ASPACDRAFT_1886662 [Aspergillus aculeatus ATCC 16872]OJK02338.1 hypothetical protein ASPACDRAFT_1886662 [Aspergillus aculeatus ATCC 16872]